MPKNAGSCPVIASRIGEAIESLNGHINGDWSEFQRELKRLFWRTDPPKETKAALFKLIDDARAGKMTVEMYVLKYTAITKVLVTQNALSKFHRNVWILEGFSNDIRSEVFECGYEKGWRMLVDDTEMEDPEFEEVQSLVLQKARGAEMEKLFQREMSESSTTLMTGSTTVSTAPTAAPTTIPSSISTASDSPRFENVSEGISKLALLLEDQSQQSKFQLAPESTPISKRQRQRRCFWCDSLEHARQDCSELKEALENGLIGFNGNGKVAVVATGEELRLMTGRGGMKEAFISMTAATATVSSAATSPEDVRAAFGHLVPENNEKRKCSAKTALKAVGVRH